MNAPFELSPSSIQYFITADVDPGVISRVTELFSLRGIVPDYLKVSRYKRTGLIRETLSIDVRVTELNPHEQEVILQKLNMIVCVQTVRKEAIFISAKAA